MDRLHRAGEGAHQGGDRDIHALALVDLPFIGVAVVLGEPQAGVVRQHGQLLLLADGVAGVQVHHLHQLSGVARRQVQARHVLQQGVELLLPAQHVLPGLVHGGAGGVGVNDKEGRAGLHGVALVDEDLGHDSRGGNGNGFAVLGLGQPAALHRGGDGAVLHHVGEDLGFLPAFLCGQELPDAQADGNENQEKDKPPDNLSPLLPGHTLPLFPKGGLLRRRFRRGRRGRLNGRGLLFAIHDF